MSVPYSQLFEAASEAEVVEAVRSYLARLAPMARAAFPAGSQRPLQTGDDVAELALALSRERSTRFGSPWNAVTLQPVEAFLARACVRLAQLESPVASRSTRLARPTA